VEALSHAIRHNATLTELQVAVRLQSRSASCCADVQQGNEIGAAGASALASGLELNRSLTDLDLGVLSPRQRPRPLHEN
jgi:hypothetical protein